MPVPSFPDLSNVDPNNSRQVVDTLAKIKKEIEWLIQHLDGSNIVANSITAEHIQAGSITSEHIQAGSIESQHISTKGLLADVIKGGILGVGGFNNTNGQIHVLSSTGGLGLSINNLGVNLYDPVDGDISGRLGWDGSGTLYISEIHTVHLYGGGYRGSPSDPIYVNAPLHLSYSMRSNFIETGYCGVGGVGNGVTGTIAGVGVNFRVRKNYTPSSITLSAISSTASANTTDITSDGFYLFINDYVGSTDYQYWRGYYIA